MSEDSFTGKRAEQLRCVHAVLVRLVSTLRILTKSANALGRPAPFSTGSFQTRSELVMFSFSAKKNFKVGGIRTYAVRLSTTA